jgi:hypothetical protein
MEQEKEAFKIDSIGNLQWYQRKVREAQNEIEIIEVQSEAMKKEAKYNLERLEARYAVEAEMFARSQIDFSKSKNLKTYQGTIQFKKVPASINIFDKKLLPERFYKQVVSRTLDNSKLREAILKDGESVEGVEAVPACEKMYLQFGGKE